MTTNTSNTAKCIECGSTYNRNQKADIYTKLSRQTTHPLDIYNDTCLDCTVAKLDMEANS